MKQEKRYKVLSVGSPLLSLRVDDSDSAIVAILEFVSLRSDQCLVQVENNGFLVY